MDVDDCHVCLTKCEGMVTLACGHGCCTDGWEAYVSSHVKDGRTQLGCVGVECDVLLTEEQVRGFISDPTVLQRYERFLEQRRLEADPSVRWCINPICGKPVHGYATISSLTPAACLRSLATVGMKSLVSITIAVFAAALCHRLDPSLKDTNLRHRVLSAAVCFAAALFGTFRAFRALRVWESDVETKISRCTSCSTEQCFSCKRPPHKGKPCAEASSTDCDKWLGSTPEVMRAPCHGCKSIIELHDGCNHMTCVRCGYQFCMLCGDSIAGRVLHHYSKGRCTRYNGEMTEAWKKRRWDFGSSPLKFTRDQVSQLMLPCVVAVTAWLFLTLRGEISAFSRVFCTPATLAATGLCLSVCIMCHERNLIKEFSMQRSMASSIFSTRRTSSRNASPSDALYVAIYPFVPQLSSLAVGLMRFIITCGDEGARTTGERWPGLLGWFVGCCESILRFMYIMWCAWITVRICLQPHVHLQANWNNCLSPSFLRPLLDLHLVANIYTAAFYASPGKYSTPFAVALCCAMVGIGAMGFLSQPTQVVDATHRHDDSTDEEDAGQGAAQPPHHGGRGGGAGADSEAEDGGLACALLDAAEGWWRRWGVSLTAFWGVYHRAVQYFALASVVVFFDATWTMRGVLYCILCGLICMTPTSLQRIPFETALLGYIQRWQEGGKKGPFKKIATIAALGFLIELAFLDAQANGKYITLLTKTLVLNIFPLSVATLYQRWVQKLADRVPAVQPVAAAATH